MKEVPAMVFRFDVTRRIVTLSGDVTLGETINLQAVFTQEGEKFFLPTQERDGATAWLEIFVRGQRFEISGVIDGNSITVTLTPEYIQLWSELSCRFYWRVGDKESNRYPVNLRVIPAPCGYPLPEVSPAPAQKNVMVANQETAQLTPSVVENRIKSIEDKVNSAGDAMVYKGTFEFGFSTQEDKEILTPILIGDGRLADGMFCWVHEMKQDYELVGGEWQIVPPTLDNIGDTWGIARFFGDFMGEEHEGSVGRIINVSTSPLLWDLLVERVASSFELTDGSVATHHLQDGAVSTLKLADSAVSTAKIANDAVTAVKLATNAVTTVKVADNAITNPKLANNAVSGDKIANGGIGMWKMANGVIRSQELMPAVQGWAGSLANLIGKNVYKQSDGWNIALSNNPSYDNTGNYFYIGTSYGVTDKNIGNSPFKAFNDLMAQYTTYFNAVKWTQGELQLRPIHFADAKKLVLVIDTYYSSFEEDAFGFAVIENWNGSPPETISINIAGFSHGQSWTDWNGSVKQRQQSMPLPLGLNDCTMTLTLRGKVGEIATPVAPMKLTIASNSQIDFGECYDGKMFVLDLPASFTLAPNHVLVGLSQINPNTITHCAVYTVDGVNYVQTGWSQPK